MNHCYALLQLECILALVKSLAAILVVNSDGETTTMEITLMKSTLL